MPGATGAPLPSIRHVDIGSAPACFRPCAVPRCDEQVIRNAVDAQDPIKRGAARRAVTDAAYR